MVLVSNIFRIFSPRWPRLLKKAFHTCGISLWRQKSACSFVERIRADLRYTPVETFRKWKSACLEPLRTLCFSALPIPQETNWKQLGAILLWTNCTRGFQVRPSGGLDKRFAKIGFQKFTAIEGTGYCTGLPSSLEVERTRLWQLAIWIRLFLFIKLHEYYITLQMLAILMMIYYTGTNSSIKH